MLARETTLLAFFAPILAWLGVGGILRCLFYWAKGDEREKWAVKSLKDRGPTHRLHYIFVTVNLLALGLISALTAELTARGVGSRLHWRADAQTALLRWGHEAGVLVWALSWQSVFEYLWHWSMHTKWLYKHVHKYHHHYKSPQVYDDLFAHPFENLLYLLLLFSPAYVAPMHVVTFALYLGVIGGFVILDHSGIHVSIPGVYSSEDHDVHHAAGIGPGGTCFYNLAFPFPFMDILCGTYVSAKHWRERAEKHRQARRGARADGPVRREKEDQNQGEGKGLGEQDRPPVALCRQWSHEQAHQGEGPDGQGNNEQTCSDNLVGSK